MAGELGKGPQGLILGRVRMKGVGEEPRTGQEREFYVGGRGDRVQGSNGDQHSQEIDVYLVSSLCLSAPLEKS